MHVGRVTRVVQHRFRAPGVLSIRPVQFSRQQVSKCRAAEGGGGGAGGGWGSGNKGQNDPISKIKAAVQKYFVDLWRDCGKLVKDTENVASSVGSVLTPRAAGDWADWTLMILSTLVLTLMSASLYRLYAFMLYPHLFN